MKNFSEKIFDLIETVDDRNQFKNELDNFKRKKFQLGRDKDGHRQNFYAEQISKMFDDSQESNQKIEDAQKTIAKLPILVLEIPFDPDDRAIRKISQWARGNIAPNILIDFKKDTSLVAGARVMYGGRYFEDNLDRMIDRVFDK